MTLVKSGEDMVFDASVGKHLALAPVAFAVTEGPEHALVYANSVFRRLQTDGEIFFGRDRPATEGGADLTPLLDRVFQSAETARDAVLGAEGQEAAAWSCTVWPVPGDLAGQAKLVVAVHDLGQVQAAKAHQRAIAERLLIGALREEGLARDAEDVSGRSQYLAAASRDLSLSLDEDATRDTVRRLALPRPGTWCIVDVVESNGALHRLAVVHPDPAKQELARRLEEPWPPTGEAVSPSTVPGLSASDMLSPESGEALLHAAHGADKLRILEEIGFGHLLVVPFVVRARVRGAITFVSPAGDPPFVTDEIALARDLAARCAMALDNARLYHEADGLRLAAERANKSKSEFLGSMSHELRTPLNAIGGFTELMELGIQGPVTDEQRVSLARIKANQQHLLVLISEILNFVRLESGRMEYHLTDLPMKHALDDVSEMLSAAVTDKGLSLVRAPDEPAAVVHADLDRVRQILMNLVMNAVKYTSNGSITLSCDVKGNFVRTRVTDTGPGIDADRLDDIFEPFVQLPSGTGERRGGVGLGLAISRDLARAMNGDLTAESTVGVGSRFTLTLPRGRAP